MRYEKRVARNRFIALVVVLFRDACFGYLLCVLIREPLN